MTKIIRFFVNFYTFSFLILSFSSFLISVLFFSIPILEAFVKCFLFWNIGIRGLLAFIANWIPGSADQIAKSYGWQEGQSFQREIAAADGAFGVIGVTSLFFDVNFALATVIGYCFCTIASEFSDILDLKKQEKKGSQLVEPSIKAGMYTDLILALVLLFSTVLWKEGF